MQILSPQMTRESEETASVGSLENQHGGNATTMFCRHRVDAMITPLTLVVDASCLGLELSSLSSRSDPVTGVAVQ